MLTRPNALTVQPLSDAQLLQKLRKSPLGREIEAERVHNLISNRTTAAETIASINAETDAVVREIDAEISDAKQQISDLATRLRETQELHGQISKRKAEVLTRQHQTVRLALDYLQQTAPPELVELAGLAKCAALSAKFQMKHPPTTVGPVGFDYDKAQRERDATVKKHHTKNVALLRRAREVQQAVSDLLCKADVDIASIARLRAYLDVPADLIVAQGTSRTQPT